MAPPSHRFSDVAEHLCLTLRFSCTDGRDTGTLATRVTPVTPAAVPTQALKCIFDRAPARRLGSHLIGCTAMDRWLPVAQHAEDRTVMVPLQELRRGSWGGFTPSVTKIVRSKSRAHDLPRSLMNRGRGQIFPPLRIHSILPGLFLLLALQRTEHRAAARIRMPRRVAGRHCCARRHQRAPTRRRRTPW